jgi:hypothetical protein
MAWHHNTAIAQHCNAAQSRVRGITAFCRQSVAIVRHRNRVAARYSGVLALQVLWHYNATPLCHYAVAAFCRYDGVALRCRNSSPLWFRNGAMSWRFDVIPFGHYGVEML